MGYVNTDVSARTVLGTCYLSHDIEIRKCAQLYAKYAVTAQSITISLLANYSVRIEMRSISKSQNRGIFL